MRYIPIKDCSYCPRKDHRGGFGRPAFIPVCRSTNKELGYTNALQNSTVIAVYDGIIPEWCPLPELTNETI
jgi:hypothetical protein